MIGLIKIGKLLELNQPYRPTLGNRLKCLRIFKLLLHISLVMFILIKIPQCLSIFYKLIYIIILLLLLLLFANVFVFLNCNENFKM